MFQQIFSLFTGLNLFAIDNSIQPSSLFYNSLNTSIAIIGSGAAGASAAYHLSNFTNNQVDITIFEKNNYIGGRVNTIEIDDESFELGASIFVTVNSILYEAANQFNLNITSADSPDGNNISGSIWNGQEIIYQFPEGSSFWQGVHFIKDFGLSPIYATYQMRKVIGNFLKLYEEPIFPWNNFNDIVKEIDLLKYVEVDSKSWLTSNTSISNKFQDILLQSLTRVNYASNLQNIHPLAAMVCLAAEDGVHQIEGGNNLIFKNWLEVSGAEIVLDYEVKEIVKEGNKWLVDGQLFDYVILASPYESTDVHIDVGDDDSTLIENLIPQVPYVELHVTYILSNERIEGSYFGYSNLSFGTILTTVSPPLSEPEFLSLSHVGITKHSNHVYKIFSYQELSYEKISSYGFHDSIIRVWRKTWLSYPRMIPISKFAEVELANNLFYTSYMDPFISTMETNALSGKNIAKLIEKKLKY